VLEIQLADNVKARVIGPGEQNLYRTNGGRPVRSQVEIYRYFKDLADGRTSGLNG